MTEQQKQKATDPLVATLLDGANRRADIAACHHCVWVSIERLEAGLVSERAKFSHEPRNSMWETLRQAFIDGLDGTDFDENDHTFVKRCLDQAIAVATAQVGNVFSAPSLSPGGAGGGADDPWFKVQQSRSHEETGYPCRDGSCVSTHTYDAELVDAALAAERTQHAAKLERAIDDEQRRIATFVWEKLVPLGIDATDSDGIETEDPAEHIVRWVVGELNRRQEQHAAQIAEKDTEIERLSIGRETLIEEIDRLMGEAEERNAQLASLRDTLTAQEAENMKLRAEIVAQEKKLEEWAFDYAVALASRDAEIERLNAQ